MLRFGAFEFDAVTRRLRRNGTDIHLPPKAFDLLALLVEATPRVVPKRELHERLWPGGTVTDATLVALIKHLRRALDDRDRKARLIRTVHRVGYALEAGSPRRERALQPLRQCWLVVGQRRLPLSAGENLVGRDANAQVRLDDPSVSRRHARIAVTTAGAQIEDLQSKNGTFLDGLRLSAEVVPVRDGSRVVFGTLAVTFHESGGGLPTLTHLGQD
jgi:DNA-binding winged helix-turn-helix (wHTH) protein